MPCNYWIHNGGKVLKKGFLFIYFTVISGSPNSKSYNKTKVKYKPVIVVSVSSVLSLFSKDIRDGQ